MKHAAVIAFALLALATGGERRVLFSVQHFGTRTVLEPVVLLDPIERPPLDGNGVRQSDRAPAQAFIKRYFVPEREYRIIGGGSVQVMAHDDPGGCADMAARAISSGGDGSLASNDSRLTASPRRRLTTAESQSANALASRIFAERGVPLSARTPIAARAVVIVRRSAPPLLVGQFTVQQSTDHGAVVFLIARRDDASWRVEHIAMSQYHDDSRRGERSFVGNVDLDGDGSDELVVRVQEIEGYAYEVFKRSTDAWRVIASGGGAGC